MLEDPGEVDICLYILFILCMYVCIRGYCAHVTCDTSLFLYLHNHVIKHIYMTYPSRRIMRVSSLMKPDVFLNNV